MIFSSNNFRRAVGEPSSRRRPRASRLGAVTVEFALTAPLFFLLLFGAAEFLRIATIRHDLQMFAYEAAGLAAIPGNSDEEVEEHAQSLMKAVGIDGGRTEITRELSLDDEAYVTVRLSAPIAKIAWYTPAIEALSDVHGVATVKAARPFAAIAPNEQSALEGLHIDPVRPLEFVFDALR